MARVLVTTSHRPSQRARSFAKDLAAVLPEAVRVNRGKSSLRDLFYDAVGYGAERVVVVGVWKGNPGLLRVYRVVVEPPEQGLRPLAEIYLSGVTLRREIPGSQKIYSVRRLAVDAASAPKGYEELLDTLSKSLLAALVFEEERLERYEVAVRLEERGGSLTLSFYCTGTWRPCGPRLKLAKVVDHEAGRTHRLKQVGGERVERATG